MVFRAIGHWKNDTLADIAEESSDGQQELQRTQPELVKKSARHEVWQLQDGWVCRACGKQFGTDAELAALAKKHCPGPMSARLLDSMGVAPTFSRFAHTVAELTRAGARPWELSLAQAASAVGGEGNSLVEVRRPRRRITGKQPDPYDCRPAVKEEGTGHLLVSKGRLTFCDRCGRWALDRLSKALARRCTGSVDTVLGAYRARRERMRHGKHPLTGRPI